MIRYSLNSEKSGIEIYFDDKPDTSVLTQLKSAGYRWHNTKKCWYAKQSEGTLSLASTLLGATASIATAPEPSSIIDRCTFTKGNTDPEDYPMHTVGSNYQPKLTTVQIAAIIRAELKARFKECKFSVTCSSYKSINIQLKSSPYAYTEPAKPFNMYREGNSIINPEINAILQFVTKFANSYNYDDSDSMVDYFNTNFYLTVEVDSNYTQTTI